MQALNKMSTWTSSSVRCSAVRPFSRASTVQVSAERLRLGNLAPATGAHRDKARKGRGTAAGQGGTCGFGNRGQKCRSGSGVRTGFEGGQTPLYRRLPKLRGIAGGMSAGLPDYVVVNVGRLNQFEAGEEVSLDTLKAKGMIKVSGRERKLPLKVLGNGTLKAGVTVKAGAVSKSAQEKIEAAGGKVEVVKKAKWTRWAHQKMVESLKAEGKDYAQEKLKKRVANLTAKGMDRKSIAAARKAKSAQ